MTAARSFTWLHHLVHRACDPDPADRAHLDSDDHHNGGAERNAPIRAVGGVRPPAWYLVIGAPDWCGVAHCVPNLFGRKGDG